MSLRWFWVSSDVVSKIVSDVLWGVLRCLVARGSKVVLR